nr:S-methyl-5-thioribose-1-phosphate isomerase [Candidatus Njordarchaeota archaeon]
MEGDASKVIGDVIKQIKSREISTADDTAKAASLALEKAASVISGVAVEEFLEELGKAGRQLSESRPTSASLQNSTRFIIYRATLASEKGLRVDEVRQSAIDAARMFREKIDEAKVKIGEIGSKRIGDGDLILTHCYSTSVLSILRKIKEEGKKVKVIVTESRPAFEGRKMTHEILRIGFPVTFIIDIAVRVFMHDVDNVIVGAEAIAANGAIVNKIGTSVIATVAHEARVRTLVAAGTYKFYPESIIGERITIEEETPSQIYENMHDENLTVRNPQFDVCPPEYIDAIITERGMIPPQGAYFLLRRIFEEEYGFKK